MWEGCLDLSVNTIHLRGKILEGPIKWRGSGSYVELKMIGTGGGVFSAKEFGWRARKRPEDFLIKNLSGNRDFVLS